MRSIRFLPLVGILTALCLGACISESSEITAPPPGRFVGIDGK